MNGTNCKFLHTDSLLNMESASESTFHVSNHATSETTGRGEGGVRGRGGEGGFSIESIWGFQDEDTLQPSKRVYSDVVGVSDSLGVKTVCGNKRAEPLVAQDQQKICTFFLSGCCKYGSLCKNIHLDFDDSERGTEKEKDGSEETFSCGICLGQPEDGGQFGLLNGCNCVFCLSCIRNWRKEGTGVCEKEGVRLCPLCRIESYFVIPAHKVVKGERKDILIDIYKESLSKLTCKYTLAGKDCPFSISCFYSHGDDEKVSPRLIVTSSGEKKLSARATLSEAFRFQS